MITEAEIPEDLKPLLFDGRLFYGKWGELFFSSKNLLTYADLGESSRLTSVQDNIYGRYFLNDIEPQWQRDSIMRDLYRYAKPWATDLSGLDNQRLMDELLTLFQQDELRVWRLTDGWATPPQASGPYITAGSAPVAGGSVGAAPTSTGKASKPKGGGTTTAQPVAAKAAVHEVSDNSPSKPAGAPKSLADCEALLQKAAADLARNGYVPKYSDIELRAMAAAGTLPNDRFLVRFSPTAESADQPIGHLRDSGRHPLWMSTFDMLERADSDPALIADVFGTKYYPNRKYTLYIIDRGEDYLTEGSDTFVPTFANMKSKLKDEFAGDIEPGLVDEVMTPEYAEEFRKHWDAFNKDVVANGQDRRDTFETKEAQRFASEYFANPVEQDKFIARQKILSEIGAWEIFTGDGLTERYSKKGTPGALEVLEIQHRPENLRVLESRRTVKAIKLSGK
tara:strand:- start:2794 stop:4146 length:1353 start_codon:yes stop_codon:yes gene_type:complete